MFLDIKEKIKIAINGTISQGNSSNGLSMLSLDQASNAGKDGSIIWTPIKNEVNGNNRKIN